MYQTPKNITLKQYVIEVMGDRSRQKELEELIKLYGVHKLELLIKTGSLKEEVNEDVDVLRTVNDKDSP